MDRAAVAVEDAATAVDVRTMEVGVAEDTVEATAALLVDEDGLDEAEEEATAPASMTKSEIS